MTFNERLRELFDMQDSPAEQHLLDCDVVQYSPHGTAHPGVNSTNFVRCQSGHEAFHKPFSGISVPIAVGYDQHPDEVPINECAAWRLAVQLGEPFSRIVAPCVMRDCGGQPGALSARQYGVPQTFDPFLQARGDCLAAGFFDSLIAQQDRHLGNFRWETGAQKLGLIDHGYAFALPGHYYNASEFVAWRWTQNEEALSTDETVVLEHLLASGDLCGLRRFMLDARSDGLEDRARRMHQRGTILQLGEF
jgi:hypothetical protein